MRVGETGSKGEHYSRCNECGDSNKNMNSAHLATFLDGSQYCYRCGHSSKLSMEALLAMALGEIDIDEALIDNWQETTHQPVDTTRFTYLTAYESEDLEDYYSFEMRNPNGDILGWHNRHKTKKTFFNDGKRGLGFYGAQLISSPDRPLVIVEGPYDIIEPHNVCVFGTLTKSSLRPLRLQFCWLFPDPDCLDTGVKRNNFASMVTEITNNQLVFVLGIIWANGDPDECTVKKYCPYNGRFIEW